MNKTVLASLIGIAFSLNAFAQTQKTTTVTTIVTAPSTSSSAPSSTPVIVQTPVSPGMGNSYEKEVTPLLREFSKKKTVLELRKLDRELEKLDEEGLKAQMERDKAANPAPSSSNLPFTPQIFPSGVSTPQMPGTPMMGMSEASREIKVFMVYGYDSNLYAKVGYGSQGGYVVKKGDVLPDGRVVSLITPNFIEVVKATKSKKSKENIEKIFVSGSPDVGVRPGAPATGGTASSASLAPTTPPALVPATRTLLTPIAAANAKQ